MLRPPHFDSLLVRTLGRGLMLLALLLLPACSSMRDPLPADDIPEISDASPALRPGYLLDVRVRVSGVDEVKEKGLRVQEDGTLTLPFLGAVNCGGMTLGGFKSWLTTEYDSKYFINPIVSVSISIDDNSSTFPWGYVTVLGKVAEPGRIRIPPTRNLTVMQSIRQAGGFIKYAKQNGIEITRTEKDGQTTRIMFNVRKVAGSAGEEDIELSHGDVVYIPEVIF
jgi:protein involved in polysaccharide export with SLBB domain